MVNELITRLTDFAEKDFPVERVSSYLQSLPLNHKSLKKYIFFRKNFYTRNLIHREKDFEILTICWPKQTDAPIHGHEGEKCWARVEDGKLQIGNYKEESKSPLRISLVNDLSCSAGYLDGPADIHSVRNISDNFATSLHVYAKPYDACDIYDIGKGRIEKKKLGYYSIDGKIC